MSTATTTKPDSYTTHVPAEWLHKGDELFVPATGERVTLTSVRKHANLTNVRVVSFLNSRGGKVTLHVQGQCKVIGA